MKKTFSLPLRGHLRASTHGDFCRAQWAGLIKNSFSLSAIVFIPYAKTWKNTIFPFKGRNPYKGLSDNSKLMKIFVELNELNVKATTAFLYLQ